MFNFEFAGSGAPCAEAFSFKYLVRPDSVFEGNNLQDLKYEASRVARVLQACVFYRTRCCQQRNMIRLFLGHDGVELSPNPALCVLLPDGTARPSRWVMSPAVQDAWRHVLLSCYQQPQQSDQQTPSILISIGTYLTRDVALGQMQRILYKEHNGDTQPLSGTSLVYLREHLAHDEDLAAMFLQMIATHGFERYLDDVVPRDWYAKKEFVLAVLRTRGELFRLVPDELKEDESVMLAALQSAQWYRSGIVASAGRFFECASFVVKAFATCRNTLNIDCMRLIPKHLLDDASFVRQICTYNAHVLDLVDISILLDRSVIIAAASQPRWRMFLGRDTSVVINLLQPEALCDKELVLALLRGGYLEILDMIPGSLSKDRSFWVEAVQQDKDVAICLPESRTRDNRVMAAGAAAFGMRCLNRAAKTLCKDQDFARVVFGQLRRENAASVAFFSQKIRSNKELAVLCVQVCPEALFYLDKSLKDNEEVVMAAFSSTQARTPRSSYLLSYASSRLRDQLNVVIAAIKFAYYNYVHASKRLKENVSVCATALAAGLKVWQVPQTMREHPEILRLL